MTWQLRALRYYAIGTTALLGVFMLSAFRGTRRTLEVDELTVSHIKVVDSSGKTRLHIAGSFPPRRNALAGILFNNSDGGEAGGLVYRGHRDENGRVSAGGTLTMDQYNEDQVVALSYSQEGTQKQEGLVVADRPDSLGPALRQLYRTLDTFPSGPRRDSTQRVLLARIPSEQLPSRRVFVGRDTSRAAVLSLGDRSGKPRLLLVVDSLGTASIVFMDAKGHATRTINASP